MKRNTFIEYVFLGIDVDSQLSKVKNKAEVIDKNIGFVNSCFTLPLHISLKASFEIDSSIFDKAIEKVINYYISIKPFKIATYKLEMFDNIIWIRMCQNKELDKVHDDLNKLLLEKYDIGLHEYDLDYKYHTTLFMDNNNNNIKEAYSLIKGEKLPQSVIANQFIIGILETGELGSYKIYKRIVELTEYVKDNQEPFQNVCAVDYLGDFAGRDNVVKITYLDGKYAICAAREEEVGFGLYHDVLNLQESRVVGSPVWDIDTWGLKTIYAAFGRRGIIPDDNDPHTKMIRLNCTLSGINSGSSN